MTKKFLLAITIVTGLFIASGAFADTSPQGCETNTMKSSFYCSWLDGGKSWCGGNQLTCQVEPPTGSCPSNPSNGTYNFSCNSCSCVLSCTGGYTVCSGNSCVANCTPGANCTACDTCTSNNCTACEAGYELISGSCVAAPIKLSSLSNVGGFIKQVTSPTLTLDSVGNLTPSGDLQLTSNKSIALTAVGTTSLWFGNYNGATPFAYGTGDVASIAVEGDVKGNRLCFQNDCRADWASVGGASVWARTAPNIYPSTLTDNVGIGTTTPSSRLYVEGSIGLPLNNSATMGVIYSGGVRFLHNFKPATNAGNNIFLGLNAGNFTMGSATNFEASYNTGIGNDALTGLTTGRRNTAVGYQSMNASNNSGVENTAIGMWALSALDSGGTNTALGFSSARYLTSGTSNVALGRTAMQYNQTGAGNTVVGYGAGSGVTANSYSYNTLVGYNAGNLITTGGNNLVLGSNSGTMMSSGSGNIVIGTSIQAPLDTGNYQITIGNIIYGTGVSSSGKTISTGNIGIGTSDPNDKFSIGNGGVSAPAGSSATGHNYTNTYLSSDSYALTNYGLVNTLIGAATSTLASSNLWFGTKNGSIWNGDAGAGNVGIGTTTPQAKLAVIGTSYLSGQITNASLSGSGQRCLYVDATGNIFAKTADCGTATSTGDNLGNSIADRNIQLGSYWLSSDGGSEGIIVKADGNVGVGAASPRSKLDVSGDINQAWSNRIGYLGTDDTDLGHQGYIVPYTATGNLEIRQSFGGIKFFTQNPSTEKMTIISDGNVGIGTTTPETKLSVNGSATFNTGAGLSIGNVGNYNKLITYSTGPVFRIFSGGAYSSFGSGNASIGSSYAAISAPTSGLIVEGNVGIGTTVPNDRFSIGNSGSAPAGSSNTGHNYTNTYLSTDDYALTNYGIVKTLIASATSSSALWGGTLGASIWNLNSTNVGVGTSTPGWKFHVVTSVAVPAAMIEGTGHTLGLKAATPYAEFFNIANTRLGFFGYGVNATDLYFANETATGPLYFSTNGYTNRRMTIDATGNVGVGTTNPISRLDVGGAIRAFGVGNAGRITAQDTNGGGASISIDPQFSTGVPGIATNGAFPIALNTNSVERMRITSDGSVGVGITNPSYKLHVYTAGANLIGSEGNGGSDYYEGAFLAKSTNSGRGTGLFATSFGSHSWFMGNPYNSNGNFMIGYRSGAFSSATADIANAKLFINPTGNVGIDTTAPNDRLSIGNGGAAAPAGSSNTGHNYTSTYLSTDDYALTNYGIVKTLIAAATSTLPTGANFWGGTLNGNIWNGAAGAGNVGIGITNPTKKLAVSGDILVNGITVGRGSANVGSNLAIGNGALLSNTTGTQSVAIGETALQANLTGSANVSIGSGALAFNEGGSNNVALGAQALYTNIAGNNNIAIGASALQGGDNSGNVVVGVNVGIYGFGDYNTVVGNEAGYNVGGTSNYNTLLGYQTGYNIAGSNNVFLGNYAGYYESGSNVLFIDNQTRASEADARAKALIYGTFDASPANQKLAINGNVGVGTSSPVKKLDVWGDAILNASAHTTLLTLGFGTNGVAYHQITSNRSTGELAIESGVGGSGHFLTFSSDNGAERMRIASSGNVGVGTTNPGAKLDIAGAANGSGLNLRTLGDVMIGTGVGSSIFFDGNYSYASGNYIRSLAANVQGFYTAGAERIRITAAGNVGIGITAPNDNFSIGNGGTSAPAGSSNTGHNYTSTYLSTDNYALANYGIVKTLIGSATSTLGTNFLPLAGGTMSGDVNFGARNITNLNNLTVTKITATTIDPLYTINDVNYSTFAPSIAGGVKEEYVGKADIKRLNSSLNEYEYIVNFALEDEGSDLWLWHKVVDYTNDNVQVFITPAGKFAEVYYQIENNKLIFRSDKPVEISYRLIGSRYDWQAWPTRAHDQVEKGVIIK